MPIWANRLVVMIMAVGFPAVVIFAWVYQITPEGLKPTIEVPHGQSIRELTGRRLDPAIIAVPNGASRDGGSWHIQGGALSGDMAATIREIFLILATPGGLGTEVLCVARKMITGTSTSGDYKLAMKFQWNAGTQKFVQAS